MLFKDLLSEVNIEDVIEYIKSKYEDNCDDAYRLMFYSLLNKDILEERDLKLFVVSQIDYFSDDEFLEVLGYSEKDDTDYALDLTPWSEWLSMEVIQKSVDLVGVVPFVAECLREMSFVSFQEEKIEDFRKSLEEQVKRIESGEEKTYTLSDISEQLQEEFGEEFKDDFLVDKRTEEEKKKDSEVLQKKIEYNKVKRAEIKG